MKMQLIAVAGATTALLLSAAPAAATITLVSASSIQGKNVLFNNGEQIGTTVVGHTQLGTLVDFTGTSNGGTTIRAKGGQARIEGVFDESTNNPNDTYTLDSLFFDLANGNTFNNLELNLLGGNATAASFTLVDNGGEVFTFNDLALGNGSNFFGFKGVDSQSIASVSISFTGGGVGDVRQIRLNEVSDDGTNGENSIPEPGTWALMILGFGGAGSMIRRRRALVA